MNNEHLNSHGQINFFQCMHGAAIHALSRCNGKKLNYEFKYRASVAFIS